MKRWLGRVVSFVIPVAFLTGGMWGLLLAGLFTVSLFRPFEVLPVFKQVFWPYSAAVFTGISAFALWLRRRLKQREG